MNAEEKAALEWLDYIEARWADTWSGFARTLKAMLAQPRLPSMATDELVDVMHLAFCTTPSESKRAIASAYRALYAHLTKPEAILAEPRQENPELRAAISALRGWSAEAAGRTGLAESVLIVCNAAEATLPVQMYRIRARGLDVVHAGPVSVSEVPPTKPKTKTETFVRWLVVSPREELGPYTDREDAVAFAKARGGTAIELTGTGEVPA